MDEILDTGTHEIYGDKTYIIASKGKRFANYLIDVVGYFLLTLLIGFIFGPLAVLFGQEDIFIEAPQSPISSLIFEWVFSAILITVYYSVLEYAFKGKTLGKLITNTRAVTEDNNKMDFQTTLLRSLCRSIPFDALSFLGEKTNGWHDKLSKTKVILDNEWSESRTI